MKTIAALITGAALGAYLAGRRRDSAQWEQHARDAWRDLDFVENERHDLEDTLSAYRKLTDLDLEGTP